MDTITETLEAMRVVPDYQSHEIMDTKVCQIYTVALRPENGANHWAFCLQATTPTPTIGSVMITCMRSYGTASTKLTGGDKSHVVVTNLPGRMPEEQVAYFVMDIAHERTTVRDVIQELIIHGRYRYEFNANGTGIRPWMLDVINLLRTAGIIRNEYEISYTKNSLLKVWPEGVFKPIDSEYGAYY